MWGRGRPVCVVPHREQVHASLPSVARRARVPQGGAVSGGSTRRCVRMSPLLGGGSEGLLAAGPVGVDSQAAGIGRRALAVMPDSAVLECLESQDPMNAWILIATDSGTLLVVAHVGG